MAAGIYTWVAGTPLPAASLNEIGAILPFPTVTTVSINPAQAGNFYLCSGGGAVTLTLPTPTAGSLVGAKLNASSGSVVFSAPGGALILSPLADSAFRTVTTFTITNPDSYLILIADGTNWHELQSNVPISDQTVTAAVATSQTTGSASFTDLATSGPAVSLVTGTTCFVTIGGNLSNSGTGFSEMSFAISGATTAAASAATGLASGGASTSAFIGTATYLVTGLTPGVNTFTCKYLAGSGTSTFSARRITAWTG